MFYSKLIKLAFYDFVYIKVIKNFANKPRIPVIIRVHILYMNFNAFQYTNLKTFMKSVCLFICPHSNSLKYTRIDM